MRATSPMPRLAIVLREIWAKRADTIASDSPSQCNVGISGDVPVETLKRGPVNSNIFSKRVHHPVLYALACDCDNEECKPGPCYYSIGCGTKRSSSSF